MEKRQIGACWRMARISPQKLNEVVKAVRGKSLKQAISILDGIPRAVAPDVKKVVLSARANAVHNFQCDPDTLFVLEATVGKNMVLRRRHIGGRSHSGEIRKLFSQLRIVLGEK